MTRTRQEIVDQFIVNWELEIRAGYTPPGELLEDLPERFGGLCYAGEDLDVDTDPALLRELTDHTNRFIEAQRTAERGWGVVTTNDSITAVLDDLRRRELVVLENGGLTIQDGWARAAVSRGRRDRGTVFFHQQDVYDALHGQSLLIAFGAFAPTTNEAVREIGAEVVAALQARGVATRWDGSPLRRIEIEPFEWRKRRWTGAPPLPRLANPRPAVGLWAKLTGRARAPSSSPVVEQPVARPPQLLLAEQHVWKRTAQRTCRGFDSWVAKGVRGAWHASGGDRGQAAHLGKPHQFLPAGELAQFVARDAFDNVCVEAEELQSYARG